MTETDYRVRLISVASFYQALTSADAEQVIFNVSPKLSESRRVEYSAVSPIHLPGSIQVYKNTSSREFVLGATFISRTPSEAHANIINLQLLRGWCTPYFGTSSTLDDNQHSNRNVIKKANQNPAPVNNVDKAALAAAQANRGLELLGAPPDVLYLYAYSSSNQRTTVSEVSSLSAPEAVNLNKIPVVITAFDFSYPDDVDYIPIDESTDGRSTPFPTKMELSLSLIETHSPSEYQRFNLADFKSGRLVNF